MKNVYDHEFVLLKDLENVECWNAVDGSTATIKTGETIKVIRVYDATHTTIRCSQEDGRPLTHPDGTPSPQMGYRFIVENSVLGPAIGVKMPKKTADLVGDLMAYENGTATPKQTAKLFKTLKKSGIGKQLQGHYSSQMD